MFRQDAFTLDVLEVPQGSGSGFVWDKEGHIVTNYHVIRGASDLKLVFFCFICLVYFDIFFIYIVNVKNYKLIGNHQDMDFKVILTRI